MTFVNHIFQVRHVVAFFMALKGLGGLLFVFGSFTGAVILVRNFNLLELTHHLDLWLNYVKRSIIYL